MRQITFFFILWVTVFSASALLPIQNIIKKDIDKAETLRDNARKEILAGNLNEAVGLYNAAVELQKAKRSQGRQVSEELLAEYAYALALSQIQSKALETLDLAMSLENSKGVSPFYIYSVLSLTGHKDVTKILSGSLSGTWYSQAPGWLKNRAAEINEKYEAPSAIEFTDEKSGIKELQSLITQDRKLEAVVYADVFTKTFPNNQTGYLLASTAWEKLNCYTAAYNNFGKACELASAPGALMPEKSLLKQRAFLLEKANKSGNRPIFIPVPMTFVYAGLGYASKSFTLQGRSGISYGQFSLSFDLTLFIPEKGDVTSTYGITGYYRWKKLVSGMGIAVNDGNFTFSPTVGLSFLNSKGTSSFDIMMNCYVPTSSGSSATFTISVGKTYYFKL